MTEKETRLLGVAFEQRIDILLGDKAGKPSTSLLYSYLNEAAMEVYKENLFRLRVGKNSMEELSRESLILEDFLKTATLSSFSSKSTQGAYTSEVSDCLYLISAVATVSSTIYTTGNVACNVVPYSTLLTFLTEYDDTAMIMRTPKVAYEDGIVTFLADRYTTPSSLYIYYAFSEPSFFSLTGEDIQASDMPLYSFWDIVEKAVSLYVGRTDVNTKGKDHDRSGDS